MIVDTGTTYTTLPASFLESLGVERVRKIRLTIANGKSVDRDIGEVGIEIIEKRASSTPVVFGDQGIYLLGSVTLEELSLAPDPVRKKLVPAEAYLLSSARARDHEPLSVGVNELLGIVPRIHVAIQALRVSLEPE